MACATCDNSAGENFGKAKLDFATGNFDGMMDCVKVLMYVQQLQGTVDKVLTYTGKLTETSVTTLHTDLMAIKFPNFELCVGTATPVDPVTPVTPAKEPVTPVTPAKEPVTPPASETKRRLQAMKTKAADKPKVADKASADKPKVADKASADKPKVAVKADAKADSSNAFSVSKGKINVSFKASKDNWKNYIDMDLLSAQKATFNLKFSAACLADKNLKSFITSMLYKNSASVNKATPFDAIWKATGAAFNMGANADAKAQLGGFLGSYIETGFQFGGKVKAEAKGKVALKVAVKPKVAVKAKVSRRLQAVEVTEPAFTTKKDGFEINNKNYESGLTIPKTLSHDGQTSVASANLLKTMIALLSIMYAML